MEPLVSILIPAYNAESWVSSTIASALAQTWSRIEVIVVDDGSTDGTLSAARRFASKKVAVVSQPNQGAAAARNRALSMCQGDYIQWLDADDLLAPDKISRQFEAVGPRPDRRILLSSPWAHFLFRTRKARFRASPLWSDLTPLEWLLRKMEHNAHMQPATWLVSRELTEAAGPWDTRLTLDDDGEYFGRVLTASAGTRFVSGARTYYRITGSGSLSYIGQDDRKLDSQCLSCLLQVSSVLSLDESVRSHAACVKYLQKYVTMFFRRPDLIQRIDRVSRELGGHLVPPRPSPRYAWIHGLFGLEAAMKSQRWYNSVKWSAARAWDRGLFAIERMVMNDQQSPAHAISLESHQ